MRSSRPDRIGVQGVFYSLAHVPDLVRYGSKPARELRARPGLGEELGKHLRFFSSAVSYAPHQVFTGNLTPEELRDCPAPWCKNVVAGASAKGSFGDILEQKHFYALLAAADKFNLVVFDEQWFNENASRRSSRQARLRPGAELRALIAGGGLPLFQGETIVGVVEPGHPDDESLTAAVLLENLSAKVTAAHSLRSLLAALRVDANEIDFVISCSEEAVGDRYNRGGGNLAKAIAEEVGCENASGCDVKAFCAGPLYAIIHGASLIRSGLCHNVAVVAGGSLAKLGMKFDSHLKNGMPVLEDVLGSCALILHRVKDSEVHLNLDSVAFHPVRAGSSPQAMAECLVERPLAKLGMRLIDVDRYAVELHNPEITIPSGSGDVPRANYMTLAALAVLRGQLDKAAMAEFVRARGMIGYAPTQGHIPSAVAYVGHALRALESGAIKNAMFISKGSLFLGRMTQLSDGCSFLLTRD